MCDIRRKRHEEEFEFVLERPNIDDRCIMCSNGRVKVVLTAQPHISLLQVYVHPVINFLMTFCDRASLALSPGPYVFPSTRTSLRVGAQILILM